MRTSITALAAAFTLAVSGGALAQEAQNFECHSETERPMNIMELAEPMPPGQAVAFVIELDQRSKHWERLRTSADVDLGALLNVMAPEGLHFDVDSAERLTVNHFDHWPVIIAHVCMDDLKWNVIDAANLLKSMDTILHAAPDSTFEPVPIIVEPVAPAPKL